MAPELLVFGVDGMDPRITEYLLNKGKLSNIKEIIQHDGEFGPLASRQGTQHVPHTGPAWLSIYTALTEREHGVTMGGWTEGDVSFGEHYDNSIFAQLVEADCTVGSAFMANTYPATIDSADGSWMISGYPSSANLDRLVNPSVLDEYFPDDYQLLLSSYLVKSSGANESDESSSSIAPVQKWIQADKRKRTEIMEPILDDKPVDVLFYGTQMPDTICHNNSPVPSKLTPGAKFITSRINSILGTSFQPPRLSSRVWDKSIREAYETIDDILGWFRSTIDPDMILLISDHGFKLAKPDHALLGTSIAYGAIERPEGILQVKKCITDSLNVTSADYASSSPEESLTEDEREDIRGQLDALGYRD